MLRRRRAFVPGWCGHAAFPLPFLRHAPRTPVVDLGMSPLCESYLRPDTRPDGAVLPLHVWVCPSASWSSSTNTSRRGDLHRVCVLLVVLDELAEARRGLRRDDHRTPRSRRHSFVVELASNDGYLLQYFVQRGIPCLGIEPAANVAKAAASRASRRTCSFFDEAKGERWLPRAEADLVLGNNVLAQVPDLNTFVAGIATSSSRPAR